jgi:voltage-gated potassium channel
MFRNPKLQVAAAMVASLLTLATIYFHFVEGWTLFDSFYFSVVTMSTVGYGQIVPATVLGKIGVIVLIFSGVGALAVLVQIVATDAIERRTKRVMKEEFDEERALLDQLEEIKRRKKKKSG